MVDIRFNLTQCILSRLCVPHLRTSIIRKCEYRSVVCVSLTCGNGQKLWVSGRELRWIVVQPVMTNRAPEMGSRLSHQWWSMMSPYWSYPFCPSHSLLSLKLLYNCCVAQSQKHLRLLAYCTTNQAFASASFLIPARRCPGLKLVPMQ